jgi:hypothetical protein
MGAASDTGFGSSGNQASDTGFGSSGNRASDTGFGSSGNRACFSARLLGLIVATEASDSGYGGQSDNNTSSYGSGAFHSVQLL